MPYHNNGGGHMEHLQHPKCRIIMHAETVESDSSRAFGRPDDLYAVPCGPGQIPKLTTTMVAVAMSNSLVEEYFLTEAPPTGQGERLEGAHNPQYTIKPRTRLRVLATPTI